MLALIAGIIAAGGSTSTAAERGGLGLNRIGSFNQPLYVHGPKGAPGMLFVVEREGEVQVLKNGRERGTFLDIKGMVRCCDGERGMFSIAFAPWKTRRFYVYFTDEQGDIRVVEFKRRKGNPLRADRKSKRNIIEVRHRAADNHNGGQLQWGPDNLLYLATGDGGGSGDPQENAQDKTSLLGKLLRIKPRSGRKGKRNYAIPKSNPYAGKRRRGDGEIYARGLRNPYRFSFAGRRIVIGDVGQDRFEEVDYETLRGTRGANFGWDVFEGNASFEGGRAPRHERPIHVYSHSGGRCSITGGYVVRDPDLPGLRGRYLYGDLCTGEIRSLKPRLGGARNDSATGLPASGGLVSFGEDSRRNIYVIAGGEVSRIVPN